VAYVARLRPFAPQLGQLARSFTHAKLDLSFREGVVVRGLTAAQADVLRVLKQPGKGKGPLLDVCTEEEWEGVLAREAAAKLGLPEAVAARVLPQAVPAPAPVQSEVSIPIEALEHTVVGAQRVQHTSAASPTGQTPAAPKTPSGPRRRGGGR